jgi:putative oxidoreductase
MVRPRADVSSRWSVGWIAAQAEVSKEAQMAKFSGVKTLVCPEPRTRTEDLGLLALRLTAGGLVAGHGAQKLFGAFGGHGLEGTAGWLESIGLKPGKVWATLAGASEFGGGMMTALGLGGPIGPIAMQGAMATAARKVHWNKPIWLTEGGAEAPLFYSVAGMAIGLAGPGRYSLDRLLGIRVSKMMVALTAAGVAAGVMLADRVPAPAQSEAQEAAETAPDTTEGGEDLVLETRPSEDAAARTAETTGEAGQADDATAAAALGSI